MSGEQTQGCSLPRYRAKGIETAALCLLKCRQWGTDAWRCGVTVLPFGLFIRVCCYPSSMFGLLAARLELYNATYMTICPCCVQGRIWMDRQNAPVHAAMLCAALAWTQQLGVQHPDQAFFAKHLSNHQWDVLS